MRENRLKRIAFVQESFGKTKSGRKRARAAANSTVERIELGDLSDNLGFLVRRVQLWVFKEVRQRLAPFDIGPAQYSVLTVVSANPGINQMAVAEALAIERAGIGRLVERLEEQDYLSRLSSTIDRRSYVLHLTSKGRKTLVRMKSIVREHNRSFAEKLGNGHYAEMLQILQRFVNLTDN